MSAGRRVGGAVVRNKARRRVKEAVRVAYADIATGWDLVFIVRPRAAEADYGEIAAAVQTLLGRAGALVSSSRCNA